MIIEKCKLILRDLIENVREAKLPQACLWNCLEVCVLHN